MSDAREVARWVFLVAASYGGPKGSLDTFLHPEDGGRYGAGRLEIATRLETLSTLRAGTVTGPALFVELCAGLGSVSLRLQGGPHCRPPVSRMGNKAGYAEAILHVLGLRAGQGAGAFLWCEPDDGCRALLQAYPQPDILREAAEIIRSWADEDPRELWERLRAEGPIRGADGGEVARWSWVQGHGSCDGRLAAQYLHPEGNEAGQWKAPPRDWLATRLDSIAASEVARWARIVTSNRLINVEPETWTNTGEGGSTHGGEAFATGAEELARGMEGVSPREVARWSQVVSANELIPLGSDLRNTGAGGSTCADPRHGFHTTAAVLSDRMAGRGLSSWPPVTVTDDGRKLFKVPEGAIVYIDPPYQGTTGYGADLGRDEVVTLARSWARRGAVVCISEAEPIPELVEDGWHNVEITRCRKGQKRTFSKQQREFLTLNRAPAWRPAEQQTLFGMETP